MFTIANLISLALKLIGLGRSLFDWLARRKARQEGAAEARQQQIDAAVKADRAIRIVADKADPTKDEILKRLEDGTA